MYNTLRVTLEGEVWKLTLQCSLSASVYNGIKQYKCKMDLTSLPSNQVQLLTEENPPQKKKKFYHTNQMLYGKTTEARQGETILFSNL